MMSMISASFIQLNLLRYFPFLDEVEKMCFFDTSKILCKNHLPNNKLS